MNPQPPPATMRMRIAGNVVELRVKPWHLFVIAVFTFLVLYILSERNSRHNTRDEDLYNRVIMQQLAMEKLHGGDFAMNKAKHDNINRDPAQPSYIEHPVQAAMPPVEPVLAAVADNKKPVEEPLISMAMQVAMTGKNSHVNLLKMQRRLFANQSRPADKVYNINVTLSESIPLDRQIDDTRPAVCRRVKYERQKLPRATVVIPFYNEAMSMLLRTVHSILGRTPDMLLAEIILVDDASTHKHLQEPLARYLRLLPKVRMVRNAQRHGLIVSRIRGCDMAKSPVVVFLDAHTECNQGWLEPLLLELTNHPNSVIQPFVDGIDAQTIAYTTPPTLYKGSFSWDLRYTWLRLSDHESARALETGYPYFSPTLVGCAIAVRKDYFKRIGQLDTGMRVWGGENIELGFRTWMCGGRVVTVICSRVGHVFKDFPYKFDGDREAIVEKNLMRVAEVWMDDARKYFYAATRTYDFKRVEFTAAESATLQKRHELRAGLNCKNFNWYLETIIPEVTAPPMDAVYYGEIMNLKTRACFETLPDYYIGVTYLCFEHKIIPRNNFELTKSGQLRLHNRCVHVVEEMPALRVLECQRNDSSKFVWSLNNRGRTWGTLQVTTLHPDGTKRIWCIMQVTSAVSPHEHEQMPQLAKCEENNEFQLWAFTYKFSFDQVPEHVMQS